MSLSVAMLSIHTSPLDTPGGSQDAGGMNVYIRELARKLALQHIKVDIFTRWTSKNTPQIVQLAPNARVIHIKAGPVAAISKNDLYQYTPTFARNIDEFRRTEALSYDIIHSHYWLSGVAATRLACYWRVPHVIMFHTLAMLKQRANPTQQEPQLRIEMEQRLLHRVDRIIAATTDEREQLINYCGVAQKQIEVVPCGVDLELFVPYEQEWARRQLNLPLESQILLFAGRLDPFKGPDLLLRAAALMKNKAHVVIAGGKLAGDLELQKLQRLAQELQISQRVHFLGARVRTEMPLLYSAADITVVPSYHETFGLAAVEALACGTPIVATRAGGLMTVVDHGETGFLVTRRPEAFAERLDQLLSDPLLCATMSAQARPAVEQYDWRNVACRINALYRELICAEQSLVAL